MPTLITWIILACSGESQDPNLEFLVSANESGTGMIHAVSLKIEGSETWWDGKELPKPRPTATFLWAKEGERERQRYHYLDEKKDSKNRPMDSGDLYLDAQTERGMHNWDPARPYALSDVEQGPLNAWIRPRTNLLPTPFPNPSGLFALTEVQPDHSFPRRSLRQFIEAAKGRVTVARDKAKGGWTIQIASPQLPATHARVTYATIDLQESANYLINRIEFGLSDSPASSTTRVIGEKRVVEFFPPRDGVTIPKRVRTTFSGPATAGKTVTELEASSLVLNSRLPTDALTFAFPENAIVREFPAVNNRVTAYVWGSNNAPARQIRSIADIVGPTSSHSSSSWTNWVGLAVLGFVLAAVSTAIYRRMRK